MTYSSGINPLIRAKNGYYSEKLKKEQEHEKINRQLEESKNYEKLVIRDEYNDLLKDTNAKLGIYKCEHWNTKNLIAHDYLNNKDLLYSPIKYGDYQLYKKTIDKINKHIELKGVTFNNNIWLITDWPGNNRYNSYGNIYVFDIKNEKYGLLKFYNYKLNFEWLMNMDVNRNEYLLKYSDRIIKTYILLSFIFMVSFLCLFFTLIPHEYIHNYQFSSNELVNFILELIIQSIPIISLIFIPYTTFNLVKVITYLMYDITYIKPNITNICVRELNIII